MEKCEGGKPGEGVTDLRESLKTMYVEPATLRALADAGRRRAPAAGRRPPPAA